MPLGVVAMFVDAALKGTVLLAVAFLLVRALRNAPAAARHLVWSVALVGVLVIPALSRTIPWKLEVLPAIPSAVLLEAPGSDRATDASGAEALGGGIPVAGTASTDQAQISLGGWLETEGTTTTTTERLWRLLSAQQLLSWAPLIWLLGVGALSVRIALSLGAIRWMAWRGVSVNPAEWHGELGAVRRLLGLTGPVRLVVSSRASIPFTTGLRRPVIVLPPASEAWDRGLRRAVLLHELAHVKRWDVLTHFVSQVGCALYWFNPLVWMAAQRLRVESERACDDLVLNSGERPTDYAGHLLSIVREAAQRRTPVLALAMARYAGLEERLDAILEFDGRLPLSRSGAGLIVAMMVLTVVPLSALAPALDADPESSVPPTDSQVGESLGLRAGSSSLNHTELDDIARAYGTWWATRVEERGQQVQQSDQDRKGQRGQQEQQGRTSLAGDWILTLRNPSGNGPLVYVDGRPCWSRQVLNNTQHRITVTQDGPALTATGVADGSGPFEMNGSIDETGVRLLWERSLPFGCPQFDFRLIGTVMADSMSGSVQLGVTVQGEWSATRVEEVLQTTIDAMAQAADRMEETLRGWQRDRQERVDELRRRFEEEQQVVEREFRAVLLSIGIEAVQARAGALAQEQRDIEAGMESLAEARLGPGSEAGMRLFERKEAMHDEIADLEREIDRLTADARANQGDAADRLNEAARTIEDDKLKERVRYSRGLIGVQDRDYTREFEAETTRIVEELREELQRVVLRPSDRP